MAALVVADDLLMPTSVGQHLLTCGHRPATVMPTDVGQQMLTLEDSMRCSSRHALVTGTSSGMGRAIALALAGRGFHVFATVRRAVDGAALQRHTPGHLTPLLMDVTKRDQIVHACEAVSAHVGQRGLDALVNNAGVGLAWPLELVPLDALRAQFEINVDGQLAVTQSFLPLIRRATGRVIMIGSI